MDIHHKYSKYVLTSFLAFLLFFNAKAQIPNFNIALEPLTISGLGGLQSYAFGQHNGKWLLVGGRLDGLHRRQPWASFDVAGHNNQLIVVDPVAKQKWSASLNSLPTGMQEQLSSTNMNFYQQGDYLYLIGGYGFSATQNDHTTYDNLTAIDVPATINAIINNSPFSQYCRQIADAQFQITGGHLEKINNTFYLIGGQKFIGRYNPMGPNNGPGFVQEYSNQIRKFNINDDGTNISITHLTGHTDTANLHRRDYNTAPQIMPNGEYGITAFSGVFQQTVDLPFLNCVNIDSTSYTVNNSFSQYYNHYHCAHFSIHSGLQNDMNTVFFGGIAQYYDSAGTLVQDNNVPFVKTIARVSRDASGQMAEHKLPVEMPALLGAGSELIPNENLPTYGNHVIKYDDLPKDSSLIGYIYGGISSSAPNIFFTNNGTQSSATAQIFKVYFIKNDATALHELNRQSVGSLKMLVVPNPNDGAFEVRYHLMKTSDVQIRIFSENGKRIVDTKLKNQPKGENIFSEEIEGLLYGGIYLISIETEYEKATQKIIVEN